MSQNDNKENNNQSNEKESFFERYRSAIGSIVKDAKNKPSEERFRDRTALILTIFIISLLIFIFWNVPFLHNLIFP